MVSDGSTDIISSWCGQFQVTVNPVTKTLSVLMFDYKPNYPKDIRTDIFSGKMSLKATKTISDEIEKFECSRQLRMDVRLKNLDTLCVVKHDESTIMYSKLKPPVKFYQRFVNVNTKVRNEWTERQTFLPFEGKGFMECSEDYMLVLGGPITEMSDIVAQILACSPEQNVNINPKKSAMSKLLEKVNKYKGTRDYAGQNDEKNQGSFKLDIELRSNILKVLKDYGLINERKCDEMKKNVCFLAFEKATKMCNYIDIGLDPCFHDYVNFQCDDEKELVNHLQTNINPGNEFLLNLKYPEQYDPADITVAEYLVAEREIANDDEIYYSFCYSKTEMCEYNRHCNICRQCVDSRRDWHCNNCNKCTFGFPNSVCRHCGYWCDLKEVIVTPGSYCDERLFTYKTQERKIGRWNVVHSTTDIPKWSRNFAAKLRSFQRFGLKTYLGRDDLGVINLWNLAFLSKSRGVRQYICHQYSDFCRANVTDRMSILFMSLKR